MIIIPEARVIARATNASACDARLRILDRHPYGADRRYDLATLVLLGDDGARELASELVADERRSGYPDLGVEYLDAEWDDDYFTALSLSDSDLAREVDSLTDWSHP